MWALMEPDEFMTREAFESLDVDERLAYHGRFMAALEQVLETGDSSVKLDFIEHYLDLMEWTLPAEYERTVMRLWETLWAHAEEVPAVLEGALASGELSESERAWATDNLGDARALAEHKRDIDRLP